MKIEQPKNEYIKSLVKLSQKKYRDASDVILVEGEHLVEEAKTAGLVHKTLGYENTDIMISESVAQKLSTTKSGSNIFAVVNKPKYSLVVGTRYLVLDNVQDPGNVGTMIRSAYSFGFDAVILTNDSADQFNDKTIRASQGSVFHIPVIAMEIEKIFDYFKEHSIATIATHVDNKRQTLDTLDKMRSLAIIMGSEGQGVSSYTLEHVDETVHIATSNFESLNVGVAAGIICYELKK